MARIPGIDVSHWQGDIDWPRVAEAGIKFAFVKATEGKTGVDRRFAVNWPAALDAGLLRGAYLFYRPTIDPVAQAAHFASEVGPLGAMDLAPVIDVEMRGPADSLANRIARLRACVEELRGLTGRDPIIYTGRPFWQQEYGGSLEFAGLPLWLAHYTHRPEPNGIQGWPWTFWQWTQAGKMPGVRKPCDLDLYRDDDMNSLLRLAGVDLRERRFPCER